MNILNLAMGMMVARNAGITETSEQIRLGLVGSMAGGVIGVALTSQMARSEVDSTPTAVGVTSTITQAPLPPPAPPASGSDSPNSEGPVLVEVPRVVGMDKTRAEKTLSKPELNLNVMFRYARSTKGKDIVLAQRTLDGIYERIVPFGATILLILSSGSTGPGATPKSTTIDDLSEKMESSFSEMREKIEENRKNTVKEIWDMLQQNETKLVDDLKSLEGKEFSE